MVFRSGFPHCAKNPSALCVAMWYYKQIKHHLCNLMKHCQCFSVLPTLAHWHHTFLRLECASEHCVLVVWQTWLRERPKYPSRFTGLLRQQLRETWNKETKARERCPGKRFQVGSQHASELRSQGEICARCSHTQCWSNSASVMLSVVAFGNFCVEEAQRDRWHSVASCVWRILLATDLFSQCEKEARIPSRSCLLYTDFKCIRTSH